ncbi:metallophosphoesterase [Pseudooctadecabacter jejudonensis]|uniref:Diadenosine tetraphosphatase n=1 Tax=Pseudooctadecabacter jejudonensis TaxID=1391910 RepID=A0A1Y5S2I5_9RHOB|nr:metallophosphoesterase [Pseudooctadecabacter jejudonensis]SLN31184.1 diadenosine tetraphosphatase [Pseudooctadecabacter jejudonensis]
MLYAIGDIHGFTDQLDRAFDLIAADGGKDAPIVFMGDYVDRGPNAKGVIETLMAGQAAGRPWTCLIGNHDLMFWRFVTQGIWQDRMIKSGKGWLHHRLGGNTTTMSYLPDLDLLEGIDPVTDADRAWLQPLLREAVPQAHLDWIANGPRYAERHGHLFVHAGIRPHVALPDQTEEDLVWIREGWIDNTDDHGVMVVHGHTALDFPEHRGNRINIDSGAGYGRTLVPTVLDDGQWYTLDETGRTPLTPSQLAD